MGFDVDAMTYEGPPLDFRSEEGTLVWENIRDATDLLECADYRAADLPEGAPRFALENDLISFVIMATFRHTYDDPTNAWSGPNDVASYVHDVAERRHRNPHCLRLHQHEKPRALAFRPTVRERPLPIGLLDGYSCVQPLDPPVFHRLVESAVTDDMLNTWDIVPCGPGEPPSPWPYLQVQAVSHLPSLGQDRGDPKRQRRGNREASTWMMLMGLYSHIAAFLPAFSHDEHRDIFIPGPGEELPKLICSRDGRLSAQGIIDGMGFQRARGKDEVGDPVYLLDYEAYNARTVGPELRRQMLRGYEYLVRCGLKRRGRS